MLSVTYGGRTEPVTRIIESSYERHREVNGPFTLSFTSIQAPDDGNPGHELLEEEALVTEDGHTYRIKQMQKSGRQKTVHAIHQYFDILNGIQRHDIFGGTKKLDDFLTWIFEGTGITFEVRGVTESQLMANFGKASGPKLIEQLLDAFECERAILPGPHLVFEKQIGPDNDEQFRWGYDVITHDYNVDTTELRTSITGFGGDGLVVTYTSPNAPLFPHAGEAEAVYDDRFLIADNFRDYIKKQLVDEPEVSIEVESLKATERELGEKIWLILDPIGLKMRSRILAKTDRKPAYKSTAVVGNTLKRTRTDDLADTNIKIDDVNDRVDDTNETVKDHYRQSETKFEQTNEYIRATANALETYTDDQVGAVRREMSAEFEVTAEAITSSVRESKTYTDAEVGKVQQDMSSQFAVMAGKINAKADSTTVSGLGTRVYNLEWDMDAVEGQITQKVSKTDYTGETIVSMVNQTSSSWKVSAKNIEMEGITTVNGTLNVGSGDGTAKELRFPLDRYGYAANIKAALAGGMSGMSFNANDITVNAFSNLYLGSSLTKVVAAGDWSFPNGLNAVAVLA